ncbi:hypothetical protein DF107_01370 [Burkholderia stagnalis]|uniref:Uncharacterized protein n=1 Tax=Burkholderia stagnalis TaxID=1503054 RepID=A0A107H238_9BURK|nr:hypothetical protein [Burkholderia stagnalis]KVN30752.1 hypothetical protein WJ63_08225 [Burkholderia pyrrocinia]WGS43689.1 hypothetical protein LFL97_09260 [Burkholderia sp. JSH-S8]AOK52668.1 hypothetical protein WT74_08125 [Burkholderia stagnalis]KAB0637454.1 hypothetical protein F7R25_15560 [Burkholderia stagnalis]KVC58708.1 hypothetical protein WS59_22895 [Burkholderia stagnalis]
MELRGSDLGDYSEPYRGFEIEVKTEQVWDGEHVHYRVLQGDAVRIDWRLVKVDGLLLTERRVIERGFDAARRAVDSELAGDAGA